MGPAGGPSWARLERVPVGTLAIGILDAKTRSLVWRASASGDLNPNDSPEKWDKKINKAAQKMFKHYPH